VDERPPGLTRAAGEPERPGPRRRGSSHLLPISVGIVVGAVAIAVAVVLLRGNGSEAAPTPTAETTSAEPVLRIIFPEGFTRKQMAKRIAAVNEIRRSNLPREFGAEGRRPRSLEGFLFPATYEFTPRTTSSELVDMQLAAFRRAWSTVDLSYARSRNLTPYDVLIIASMIEGEVRVPRERRLVAAVIYNRLRADMPLGIDATIRYGLGIPPDQSLRQSHLESDSPYNTRIHQGLPPTPINNPGLAAMKAAARPADVDYLYYARKRDCKSHFFTASFAKFQQFLAGPRC
jgi:UPF0755 protein